MPSRDRLADIDFKLRLIDALEQALRTAEPLKALRNRRQQENVAERLKDDRPLADVLQMLIRSSPNLTALLELGQRISTPFFTKPTGGDDLAPYRGEVYPTYFKTKGVGYGALYKRSCPINQRMRLTFETDARDDYFTRRIERGRFYLVWRDREGRPAGRNLHKADPGAPRSPVRTITSAIWTSPGSAAVGRLCGRALT